MKRSGGSVKSILLLFFLFTSSLFAREEITFYSQSKTIVQKNERYVSKQYQPHREIIFLTGEYELLDTEKSVVLGKISVPSVFHQNQSFIFQKNITEPIDKSARYFLHFQKIVGEVSIFLNETLVYEGRPNFLSHRILLESDAFLPDGNKLIIHLAAWDASVNDLPAWFPINLPRIDSGIGGLVFLEKTSSLFIDEISLEDAPDSDTANIQGTVMIMAPTGGLMDCRLEITYTGNSSNPQTATLFIPDDSLNTSYRIPFSLPVDSLPRWSPGSPRTFELLFSLYRGEQPVDAYRVRTGFRKVRFQQNRLFLNERPIFLKGINYVYQDTEGAGLFDHDLVLRDLLNIQSKGFNAVRIAFFPQNSQFYHLTDSLGIVCLQDLSLPLFTENNLSDSLQLARISQHIQSFQKIARRHPSVLGLGLNQFYLTEQVISAPVLAQINNLVSDGQRWFPYYSLFGKEISDPEFTAPQIVELLDRKIPPGLDESGEDGKAPILFSGLSMPIRFTRDTLSVISDLESLRNLQSDLQKNRVERYISGEFLLTYSDYYLDNPSLQLGNTGREKFMLNPRGLYSLDRLLKTSSETAFANNRGISIGNNSKKPHKIEAYLFLIIGIINFFIFLFIYRSFVDFRKNVSRSIRRPHGFFVELLERRLISNEQSFYLLLVISINAGVMLGGVIYFFKTQLILDYLLSVLIKNAGVKYYLSMIIWKPYYLIPAITIAVIFTFYLSAIPVQIIALLSRSRIRWRQALATGTWSASPYLLLIPFGLFFYNLLSVLNSYWILGAILLYFHVWYFLRWLNGTRVMAVSSYTRVFIFTVVIMLISFTGLYLLFYYQVDLLFHFNVLTELFHFYS